MWLPLAQPLLGTWPAAQACALTGNRTGDSLVCRLALSPLSHTGQGDLIMFYGYTNLKMVGRPCHGPHWMLINKVEFKIMISAFTSSVEDSKPH